MAKLTFETSEADSEYRIFRNEETGRLWKVKLVSQEARRANVEAPVELAAAEIAVTVTVSPIDEETGKAQREDGRPIVIDSTTHTFNEHEVRAPDFDAQQRIMSLIEERVDLGEARLAGFDQVREVLGTWGAGAATPKPLPPASAE